MSKCVRAFDIRFRLVGVYLGIIPSVQRESHFFLTAQGRHHYLDNYTTRSQRAHLAGSPRPEKY